MIWRKCWGDGAGAESLPSLLPTLNAQPTGAAVSPDGRWIAYPPANSGPQ